MYLFFVVIFGRHKHNGGGVIGLPDGFSQFKPTDPGQHHIQQDQVVFGGLEKLEGSITPVLHVNTVIL